jgi:hypothetical protein
MNHRRNRPFIPAAAMAAGICAAAACAQDSWSDQSSGMSASGSTAAPADASAGREADGTYIVKRWDTLWDLAQTFMSDPWKWRAIWQANPQINNPDLIFPGDKLVIPPFNPSAGAEQAPAAGTPLGRFAAGQGLLDIHSTAEEAAMADSQKAAAATSAGIYPGIGGALEYKGFFSPEFMAKIGYLVFDKDGRGVIYPGNGVIEKCKKTDVYHQFDSLDIILYGTASYAPGDSIDIIHPDRFVKFGVKTPVTANLVRPVARACVTYVSNGEMRARIVKAWDVIGCRDRVAATKSIAPLDIDAIVDAATEIIAAVFARVEETESPYLYQTFIIESGAADGVQMGDLFLVYPVDKKTAVDEHPSVLACVVNLGEHSSTLVIVKMFANRIASGDQAKLVKRIRFRQ